MKGEEGGGRKRGKGILNILRLLYNIPYTVLKGGKKKKKKGQCLFIPIIISRGGEKRGEGDLSYPCSRLGGFQKRGGSAEGREKKENR